MTESASIDVANLPKLPEGWSYAALEELLEPNGISYGIVQPGNHDPAGIPIVRVKDLKAGKINRTDPLRVSSEVESKYSRTRLKGGEVLVSLVGSVGETAVATSALSGWNVARAVGVLRVSGQVTASWIRTCLDGDVAQHYMLTRLNTTVQATLNLRDVRRIPIVLPPERERQAIAAVVAALDSKVAVNDHIATTTEALLRNLYLAQGATGDEIRIGDIGYLVRESVKPDSLSSNEPYIGLEHMPRKQVWLSSWGESSAVGSVKSAFKKGDILFGKLRPYFHKVGMAQVNGVCSTDILAVRASETGYRSWLLMALSSEEVVTHATARSDGTRMPRAKWSDLADFKVPWPGAEQVTYFEETAVPLIERAERGAAESRALVRLRDTLLPQLMSGKLRVRDAEKIVEGAV
ncbi:restriction endonuclease subunit S [Streptomyces sp. NPDC057403]|uniref:restriction endonuclease subunit S n=1 Tax=Streptomyces sp. NPDC057403 TaxID=3346119 RepID=UPI0036BF4FE3